MASRDVARNYSVAQFAAKLRRLADALEADRQFRIQVAGERIRVPKGAAISVEHEREDDEEDVEFQLKWHVAEVDDDEADNGETECLTGPAVPTGRKARGPGSRHIIAWLPGSKEVPKSGGQTRAACGWRLTPTSVAVPRPA